MTAVNPAKKLGVFNNKGSVAINKDADLVVLDDDYQVRFVMINGRILYS